jgi:hypothetical protein
VVGLGSVPGLLKDRNGVLLCVCRPVPVEHRPGDGFQPLGALRELRRLTSSLLDLGFGGVSLYAQGHCEANVPVIGLESLVWWACDSEVIHDGGGGQFCG